MRIMAVGGIFVHRAVSIGTLAVRANIGPAFVPISRCLCVCVHVDWLVFLPAHFNSKFV